MSEIIETITFESKKYNKVSDHTSPKKFVDEKKLEMKELPTNPSDKELQLLLNSTNEAAKASNDELWTLQDFKDKIKRPNSKIRHYFLFHYDDKPIGGAMYMGPDNQCTAFSIGEFAIYKEYRGKGFGSKCFKMLLDKIKKSNNTLPIYLGVHVDNTKAIELYKKFGFKIAKTMEENGNKFHQMFLGNQWNARPAEDALKAEVESLKEALESICLVATFPSPCPEYIEQVRGIAKEALDKMQIRTIRDD